MSHAFWKAFWSNTDTVQWVMHFGKRFGLTLTLTLFNESCILESVLVWHWHWHCSMSHAFWKAFWSDTDTDTVLESVVVWHWHCSMSHAFWKAFWSDTDTDTVQWGMHFGKRFGLTLTLTLFNESCILESVLVWHWHCSMSHAFWKAFWSDTDTDTVQWVMHFGKRFGLTLTLTLFNESCILESVLVWHWHCSMSHAFWKAFWSDTDTVQWVMHFGKRFGLTLTLTLFNESCILESVLVWHWHWHCSMSHAFWKAFWSDTDTVQWVMHFGKRFGLTLTLFNESCILESVLVWHWHWHCSMSHAFWKAFWSDTDTVQWVMHFGKRFGLTLTLFNESCILESVLVWHWHWHCSMSHAFWKAFWSDTDTDTVQWVMHFGKRFGLTLTLFNESCILESVLVWHWHWHCSMSHAFWKAFWSDTDTDTVQWVMHFGKRFGLTLTLTLFNESCILESVLVWHWHWHCSMSHAFWKAFWSDTDTVQWVMHFGKRFGLTLTLTLFNESCILESVLVWHWHCSMSHAFWKAFWSDTDTVQWVMHFGKRFGLTLTLTLFNESCILESVLVWHWHWHCSMSHAFWKAFWSDTDTGTVQWVMHFGKRFGLTLTLFNESCILESVLVWHWHWHCSMSHAFWKAFWSDTDTDTVQWVMHFGKRFGLTLTLFNESCILESVLVWHWHWRCSMSHAFWKAFWSDTDTVQWVMHFGKRFGLTLTLTLFNESCILESVLVWHWHWHCSMSHAFWKAFWSDTDTVQWVMHFGKRFGLTLTLFNESCILESVLVWHWHWHCSMSHAFWKAFWSDTDTDTVQWVMHFGKRFGLTLTLTLFNESCILESVLVWHWHCSMSHAFWKAFWSDTDTDTVQWVMHFGKRFGLTLTLFNESCILESVLVWHWHCSMSHAFWKAFWSDTDTVQWVMHFGKRFGLTLTLSNESCILESVLVWHWHWHCSMSHAFWKAFWSDTDTDTVQWVMHFGKRFGLTLTLTLFNESCILESVLVWHWHWHCSMSHAFWKAFWSDTDTDTVQWVMHFGKRFGLTLKLTLFNESCILESVLVWHWHCSMSHAFWKAFWSDTDTDTVQWVMHFGKRFGLTLTLTQFNESCILESVFVWHWHWHCSMSHAFWKAFWSDTGTDTVQWVMHFGKRFGLTLTLFNESCILESVLVWHWHWHCSMSHAFWKAFWSDTETDTVQWVMHFGKRFGLTLTLTLFNESCILESVLVWHWHWHCSMSHAFWKAFWSDTDTDTVQWVMHFGKRFGLTLTLTVQWVMHFGKRFGLTLTLTLFNESCILESVLVWHWHWHCSMSHAFWKAFWSDTDTDTVQWVMHFGKRFGLTLTLFNESCILESVLVWHWHWHCSMSHAFWKAFWSDTDTDTVQWVIHFGKRFGLTLTLTLQCFAFASEFVLDQFVAPTKPSEIGQLAWKNEPKPLEPATRLPHHQPCKFGSNRVRREWALLSTRTHHGFPPSKTVVDTPRGRRDHRVMPQAGGPLGATVQRFTGIVPKPWRAYGRPPDLERIAALTWTTYPSMLRMSMFLATLENAPPPPTIPYLHLLSFLCRQHFLQATMRRFDGHVQPQTYQ